MFQNKLYNFLFSLLILLIITSQILCDTNSEKTETCDSTLDTCEMPQNEPKRKSYINEKGEEIIIHDKLKTLYSNVFIHQPYYISKNNSNEIYGHFDFRINKKMLKFLNENGMITYPRERYIGKSQGNFLHFMHLAYSKNLPLYFDVDQILYPYIDITKNLISQVLKKGLYDVMKEFLINVINYGKKEKYEQGILLYFSIGLKLLDKKEKNNLVHDDVCENMINNLLTINKGDTNTVYNFTLMNHVRSIDKLSFEQRHNLFKGDDKLESLSNTIRFFQNFFFNLENELYTVYKIGNLITKSGQDIAYQKIKKFIEYIFSQQEYVLNPVDIYSYINTNYKNYTMSNDTANILYEKIKNDLIINQTYLKFMGNNTFMNEEEKELFNKEKNTHTNLFSYPFLLEEYISYKLLNYDKFRYYSSYFEFVDIVHHGKLMKDVIYSRYKGKTITGGRLLQFRDGIDVSDVFNYTKKTVKESMITEKETWLNSYENSFHYLLNIVGHIDHNLKKKEDIKIKVFNSLIGAYTHFKHETLLFQQKVNITYNINGSFLDLYFNPNVKFYQTLEKISTIFQKNLLDIISLMTDKSSKIKIEQNIERKMKRLFTGYENILKAIEIQDKVNIKGSELKKMRDNMFHYDEKKKKYKGWYVDLYKDNKGEINYSLDIYLYNYFMAQPLSKIKFKGILDYVSMNYPEFGLITIGDGVERQKKIFLFSSYLGNEYPILWAENVNFKGLKDLIMSRR